MKQLQKIKQQEKQQSIQQMNKLTDDINLLIQQLQTLREENQTIQLQSSQFHTIEQEWIHKYTVLESELKEARMNSLQGAQSLREELRQAMIQNESLQMEHSNILRQYQIQQSHYETEVQQLNQLLSESQREIEKLKTSTSSLSNQQTKDELWTRELMKLQKEYQETFKLYEQQKEMKQEIELKYKQLDRDYRILIVTTDEERQRHHQQEQKLQQQIYTYEQQQQQQQQSSANSTSNSTSTIVNNGSSFLHSHSMDMSDETTSTYNHKELKQQIDYLSKMLLKKQSELVDNQNERIVLKTKNQDYQQRIQQLELQLQRLQELDEDDDDLEYDLPEDNNNNNNIIDEEHGYLRNKRSNNNNNNNNNKLL
jgi:hypothetical protein